MSSAYRSLFINTSRAMMEYATYPMPADFRTIRTTRRSPATSRTTSTTSASATGSASAPRSPRSSRAGDGWEVTLDDGETHRYDAVLVANGHHWDPKYPEPPFPGQESFTGEQLHSHWYREPDERFVDRNVLVLGIGNSATDIAVETSRHSATTYLAMRRGAYVLPKFVGGVPLDQLGAELGHPPAVQRSRGGSLMREVKRGAGTDGELRPAQARPQARARRTRPCRPTCSTRIGHGRIAVKPNIERIDGSDRALLRRHQRADRHDRLVHRLPHHLPVPRPRR